MDVARPFSRRSLSWILFFFIILYLMVAGAAYWVLNLAAERLALAGGAGAPTSQFSEMAALLALLQERFWHYFLPATAAVFLFTALLLWLLLRSSLKSLLRKATEKAPATGPSQAEKAAARKGEQEGREKRLYLYLVSLLQREGRLLDFLAENLELYEDDQIGAAVRSIHESCKKSIDKSLNPGAVIDQDEGEEVSVAPGFDPNAVKLTGNVVGDPPFKGILRHKGWKARKIELPAFSGTQDYSIIAPAEVEVHKP